MGDVIERHANYGLELTDRLTQQQLLGENLVTVTTDPDEPEVPTVFRVNRSRWVFEDLGETVTFSVSSEFYLPRTLVPGSGGLPAVPSASALGVLVPIELTPAAGYPFPRTLTRAVGAVRVSSSLDPLAPVVPGAQVTVTPIHSISPLETGDPFVTSTDELGLYAVWFLPDVSLEPTYAIAFDVEVEATVDIAGVPTAVTGGATEVPLVLQALNGVATIDLDT